MLLREYEITFVLTASLDEEAQAAAIERVNGLIAHGGGSITEVHAWGRRRLAYPIEHQRDGFYVTTRFKMPPLALGAFENDLRLSEVILRHLLVRQDEVPIRPVSLVVTAASSAPSTILVDEALDEPLDEDDVLVEDIDPDLIPAAEE